jgi:hypothetical protein
MSGLLTNGSRATEIITMPDIPANDRVIARQLSQAFFIENKGSGTLRKNARIGFNVQSHYLAERVAYEFGYEFQCLPERFVTWGQARSEPDCSAITEAGWFAERYADICLFPGDEIEVKYVMVEHPSGEREEGIGIVVRKTSAYWVPPGHMVFAIIAKFDHTLGDFLPARNPC